MNNKYRREQSQKPALRIVKALDNYSYCVEYSVIQDNTEKMVCCDKRWLEKIIYQPSDTVAELQKT